MTSSEPIMAESMASIPSQNKTAIPATRYIMWRSRQGCWSRPGPIQCRIDHRGRFNSSGGNGRGRIFLPVGLVARERLGGSGGHGVLRIEVKLIPTTWRSK